MFQQLIKFLPPQFTSPLSPLYNQIESRRASRRFAKRSLPAVEADQEGPHHVVLLVVDGFRYDAYRRAAEALDLNVTEAVAAGTWTYPSVSSMLTGRYPHQHGAMRQADNIEQRRRDEVLLPPRLSESTPTLSTLFAGAGFETMGAFGMYMPFHALFGQFEHNKLYQNGAAARVLSDHLTWLRSRSHDQTFSYVHLADLHEPIDPPERFWEGHDVDDSIPEIRSWDYLETATVDDEGERYREHKQRLYDAAVEYVVEELSEYASVINSFTSNVSFVVTSDHGEAFWEKASFDEEHFFDGRPAYGVGHGGTPYEAVAKVPLATSFDIGTVDEPVSTIDVAPTLLEMVGIDRLEQTTGTSLLKGMGTEYPLIEATRYGYERKATYDGDQKLLASKRDDIVAAFKLPDETKMSLSSNRQQGLLERLPEWPNGESVREATSGEVARRLENLGYR